MLGVRIPSVLEAPIRVVLTPQSAIRLQGKGYAVYVKKTVNLWERRQD